MRSALVALTAATTFFVGALELGGGGSERPLPGRIDAGASRSASDGVPPSMSSFTVAGFEIVPSAIREQPVADYEPSQKETAGLASDRRPSAPAARERPENATPTPEPTPTPSDTASQTPTATPSPSPSPAA
jgi:hypothetical protein